MYASFQVVYVVGVEGLDEVKIDAQKLYIHKNKTKILKIRSINNDSVTFSCTFRKAIHGSTAFSSGMTLPV